MAAGGLATTVATDRRAKRAWWGRAGGLAPLAPILLLLGGLYAYPLARTLQLSVGGSDLTLSNFTEFFQTGVYVHVLWYTMLISAIVTVLCLTIGFPVAFLLATTRSTIRNVLFVFVLVPWLVTELVRNFAWVVILQEGGVLAQLQAKLGLSDTPLVTSGTTAAVIVAMVYVQLPLAILPLYAVLRRIDLSLLTAASSLGGSPRQVIQRILIPLSLPGLVTASMLTFLTTLGFYVTPLILGGQSDLFMANLIDTEVSRVVDWNFGSALAVILAAAGLGVVALGSRLVGWKWLIGE